MIIINGSVLGLKETFAAFGQFESILRQAGIGAMTESLEHVSTSVRSFLQGPYPTEIERRSGSFRATWQRGNAQNVFTVQAQGTQILGTIGSNDKRARILDEGDTILPKQSQFLAIRTEFTKTGRGVVKAKYQQPLRNVPNTFVRMWSADKGTVYEKFGRGKRARIEAIALLRRSVTIVGRHYKDKGEAKATPGVNVIFQQKFDTVSTRFSETLSRVGGRT